MTTKGTGVHEDERCCAKFAWNGRTSTYRVHHVFCIHLDLPRMIPYKLRSKWELLGHLFLRLRKHPRSFWIFTITLHMLPVSYDWLNVVCRDQYTIMYISKRRRQLNVNTWLLEFQPNTFPGFEHKWLWATWRSRKSVSSRPTKGASGSLSKTPFPSLFGAGWL